MAKPIVQEFYLNLPVKNLDKSINFFKKLGFTFNKQFTDKNAGCLVLGNGIYAMLVTEKMFKGFAKTPVAYNRKSTSALHAVQVKSKKIVDDVFKKAIRLGAKKYRPTDDIGWMYTKCFADLDGHKWEFFWMNKKKIPKY